MRLRVDLSVWVVLDQSQSVSLLTHLNLHLPATPIILHSQDASHRTYLQIIEIVFNSSYPLNYTSAYNTKLVPNAQQTCGNLCIVSACLIATRNQRTLEQWGELCEGRAISGTHPSISTLTWMFSLLSNLTTYFVFHSF